MLGQSVAQQPYGVPQYSAPQYMTAPVGGLQAPIGGVALAQPTIWDTLTANKWIIIAVLAALIYMRYFNKKPTEEEKGKR
jgi:hypothetical protein